MQEEGGGKKMMEEEGWGEGEGIQAYLLPGILHWQGNLNSYRYLQRFKWAAMAIADIYDIFVSLNCFIFFYGFSAIVICILYTKKWKIHRNKNVSESKNDCISHLFDLIKVSRVPLEIGLCHLLMELRFFHYTEFIKTCFHRISGFRENYGRLCCYNILYKVNICKLSFFHLMIWVRFPFFPFDSPFIFFYKLTFVVRFFKNRFWWL